MTEKRKSSSREFKIETLQLLNTNGKCGHKIDVELGIGVGCIYRCRRKAWRVLFEYVVNGP